MYDYYGLRDMALRNKELNGQQLTQLIEYTEALRWIIRDPRQLRKYRKLNNMTLKEVARAVGISYQHLSDIERGKRPSLSVINKLIDFYL